MDTIKKVTRQYGLWTMILVVTMYAGAFFFQMGSYGLISAAYHILFSTAYIFGWEAIARRSPDILPKYYLAGSAFRLMAAAVVLLVFCVVHRGDVESIKWFTVVFIIFYLVILVFDAIFFAKISINNKVNK